MHPCSHLSVSLRGPHPNLLAQIPSTCLTSGTSHQECTCCGLWVPWRKTPSPSPQTRGPAAPKPGPAEAPAKAPVPTKQLCKCHLSKGASMSRTHTGAAVPTLHICSELFFLAASLRKVTFQVPGQPGTRTGSPMWPQTPYPPGCGPQEPRRQDLD